MPKDRGFVYAVCGAASHIQTLQHSLRSLRARTALPIFVVTDSRRNEMAIDHANVIDVETPAHFNNHRASIFLKTSLHRRLPAGADYAYLDTDIIAAAPDPDSIFDHQAGPVTFAHDLNLLENRVGVFSPWAMNCGCSEQGAKPCSHLAEAIHRKFGVAVSNDWLHWNGGVFLFGPASALFLDTWHSFTMEIFEDSEWKTRDQGSLIATVWKLGLQDQGVLPPRYNFLVDEKNADVRFDRATGYTLHASIPGIRPVFLHLYHSDLHLPEWDLARDVENVFEAKNPERAARERIDYKTGKALAAIAFQLRQAPVPPGVMPYQRATYRLVVGLADWSSPPACRLAEILVRGLITLGVDARILLTEPDGYDPQEQAASPVPLDLPCDRLRVAPDARWGARWGALVSYLEEFAPCLYLPVGDWRNSVVCSQLSCRVAVVGVVLDDARSFDEAARLGRYWNAALTASGEGAAHVARLQPSLVDRVVTLPPAMEGGRSEADEIISLCRGLFEMLAKGVANGALQRPHGLLRKPPYQAGGAPVLPIRYFRGIRGVGVFPSYREDYEAFRAAVPAALRDRLPAWDPHLVETYPAIFGASRAPDNDEIRFIAAMLTGLKHMDHPAKILMAAGASGAPATALSAWAELVDGPVRRRWRSTPEALARYLERQSPCVYLPGSDPIHHEVCPRLSDRVAVIGRVDDPDPRRLGETATAASSWNAIVAGSAAIADHLLRLNPDLAGRVVTIPLPAELPPRLAGVPIAWGATLRVAVLQASESPQRQEDIARVFAMLAETEVPVESVAVTAKPDPAMFEAADVLLVMERAESVKPLLLEAMRHACIPVIARPESEPIEFINDGENGYVLSAGDISGFAERVAVLQGNAALRRGVAARAYESTNVFFASYAILLERVFQEIELGTYRRPRSSTWRRLSLRGRSKPGTHLT